MHGGSTYTSSTGNEQLRSVKNNAKRVQDLGLMLNNKVNWILSQLGNVRVRPNDWK